MTAMRAPSAAEQSLDAARRPPSPGRRRARRSGRRPGRLTPHARSSSPMRFRPHRLGLASHVPRRRSLRRGRAFVFSPNWSMLVPLATTFIVFYFMGLYDRELLSLRALLCSRWPRPCCGRRPSAPGRVSAAVAHRLPVARHRRRHLHHVLRVRRGRAHGRASTRLGPTVPGDMGGTLVVGSPYRTEPLRGASPCSGVSTT